MTDFTLKRRRRPRRLCRGLHFIMGSSFIEMLEPRRLLNAGQLDATFGAGGIAAFDKPASVETGVDLAVLEDGRVIALGQYRTTANHNPLKQFELARLTSTGALDPTFA